jgi:L-amino acid N-acyltransferase YncA
VDQTGDKEGAAAMNPGPRQELPQLVIRDCLPEDLPSVQRIYAHYVRTSTATFEEEPPQLDYWRGRLDEMVAFGLPFLVATVDGEVMAYAFCSRWRPRPAYRFTGEDSIYVAPEAAGKGIGGRLLPELLRRCAAAGIREIIAVIATGGNDASLRLHKRLGFHEIGRLERVGFKFDRWLDTIILQRSLADERAVPEDRAASQDRA